MREAHSALSEAAKAAELREFNDVPLVGTGVAPGVIARETVSEGLLELSLAVAAAKCGDDNT